MHITFGKLLSLVIALSLATMIFVAEGGLTERAFRNAATLLVPLALIWFPDELGSMTGYVGRGGHIGTETPPLLVYFMGWLILVGLPTLLYLLN